MGRGAILRCLTSICRSFPPGAMESPFVPDWKWEAFPIVK